MTIDLEAIVKRAEAATPGPWQWFGNTKQFNCYLATIHGGRRFVLQFDRWGMSSAQPTFQVYSERNGLMVKLAKLPEELGPKFEADHRRDFCGIAHPDAEFIAHARQDIDDLLAEVDRLQSENESLRRSAEFACEEPCGRCGPCDAAKDYHERQHELEQAEGEALQEAYR